MWNGWNFIWNVAYFCIYFLNNTKETLLTFFFTVPYIQYLFYVSEFISQTTKVFVNRKYYFKKICKNQNDLQNQSLSYFFSFRVTFLVNFLAPTLVGVCIFFHNTIVNFIHDEPDTHKKIGDRGFLSDREVCFTFVFNQRF